MSGVSMEVAIRDREVRRNFSKLERAMKNTTPVMEAIGTGLVGTTTKRFVTQTGPDGGAWAALNPAYASGKRNSRILTESGRLRDSISHVAGNDVVRIGSNVIYAAIHQFGGEIKAKGGGRLAFFIGGRMVRPVSVTIDARPYLGISSADEVLIGEIISGFVARHIS